MLSQDVIQRGASRGISRDQRAKRIAASAERSNGIVRGRTRLAKAIEAVNGGDFSITTRFKSGPFQVALVKLINSKHPNVSSFEKNSEINQND